MNVEDNQITSGESVSESSGPADNANDSVSFASYRKVLSEKKRRDAEVAELKALVEKTENERLTAEGKKDELITNLQKQLSEREKILKEQSTKFAWNVVSGQIKDKATKSGCVNPDKLLKLLDKADLDSVEIGDGYSISTADLDRLIEKAKGENPFLFQVKQAQVRDLTPANNPVGKSFDASTASADEILNKLKTL